MISYRTYWNVQVRIDIPPKMDISCPGLSRKIGNMAKFMGTMAEHLKFQSVEFSKNVYKSSGFDLCFNAPGCRLAFALLISREIENLW